MKENIEDIKRGVKTFIEARVILLENKVFAAFPEQKSSYPCCVIDVVASKSQPLYEGGFQQGLLRLTIVHTDTKSLDQLFDDVHIAFIKYGYLIEDFSYEGIFAITPTMPALVEKGELFKREMDIDISWIIVR